MLQVSASTLARSPEAENEDAMVVGDDVAVVVDGAGLPPTLRAGCHHSVAWFARSIASELSAALVARTGGMREALAAAVVAVAGGHASTCDLAAGSPSATVAAWRRTGGRLEHLVLCDASLILVDRRGRSTAITDRRLEGAHHDAIDRLSRARTDATPASVWWAARVEVEALRNRAGGFWCVGSDASAAAEALVGETELQDLAGVIACSDGATRSYDLLASHTLERFAHDCLTGDLASVAAEVRRAEREQASALEASGMKVHDDLTIVAGTFDPPR